MARNIIKSNNSVVAVQNGAGSAFSTTNLDLNLFTTVQGAHYNVPFGRSPLKQLGSQVSTTQDLMREPDVELSLTYYPEPTFSNELNGGLLKTFPTANYVHSLSGVKGFSTNFYVLNAPDQADDALQKLTFDEELNNLNNWDATVFGNCYLTNYQLRYGVRELPLVSMDFICSNMQFETLTGTDMQSPAVNLENGNATGGRCLFQFDGAIVDPPIVNPNSTGSSVTLENLQVGGQSLADKQFGKVQHFIQSLDLSVSMDRASIYGLGNNFAYDRKLELPARGIFNVSSLVSGVGQTTGSITGLLTGDSSYQFDLVLEGSGKTMKYQIQGAKLDSINYGMPVNGMLSYDASFNFEVTESYGLRLSGTSTSS